MEANKLRYTIPSKCAKVIESHKARCFTSIIDPMGSFGDCYPVVSPQKVKGKISIKIATPDEKICCSLI